MKPSAALDNLRYEASRLSISFMTLPREGLSV